MTSHRHKVRGARCAAREEGSAGGWILPKPLFWCVEERPGFAIDKNDLQAAKANYHKVCRELFGSATGLESFVIPLEMTAIAGHMIVYQFIRCLAATLSLSLSLAHSLTHSLSLSLPP